MLKKKTAVSAKIAYKCIFPKDIYSRARIHLLSSLYMVNQLQNEGDIIEIKRLEININSRVRIFTVILI